MKIKKIKIIKKVGTVISSIGIGIVLAVVVPIWGWVMVIGLGLIFAGWYIAKNSWH